MFVFVMTGWEKIAGVRTACWWITPRMTKMITGCEILACCDGRLPDCVAVTRCARRGGWSWTGATILNSQQLPPRTRNRFPPRPSLPARGTPPTLLLHQH